MVYGSEWNGMTRTEGTNRGKYNGTALKMESVTCPVSWWIPIATRDYPSVFVHPDHLVQVILFDPSLLCNMGRPFEKPSLANT
jgi:hypothetical protein